MRSFPPLLPALLPALALCLGLLAACQTLAPPPEAPVPAEDGYLPREAPIRPLAAD